MTAVESDIYVGPAGWHYKDWYGPFYPKPAPKGFKELDYLARYFNTAEINSTFYRPANPFMGAAWVRKVAHNPLFCFTAKLWQQFTHAKGLLAKDDAHLFMQGIDPLLDAGKLGALLCQFPWSFKNEEQARERVSGIARLFSHTPLVFEFRHQSWNSPGIRQFISGLGAGIAAIDQPVIGNSIPFEPVHTGHIGYVRLHGRNYKHWFPKKGENQPASARYDYLYSAEELDQVKQVVSSAGQHPGRTFVIFNNHPWGQAVANAAQLRTALGQAAAALPDELIDAFPDL